MTTTHQADRCAAPKKRRPRATTPTHPLPQEGYCRLRQVLSVIPVGETTWAKGIKAGRFPAPVYLGRSALWKVSDIRRLLAEIEAGIKI